MSRIKFIQSIFDNTNFKNYLEIGCYKGKTYFKVKATNKLAVDPHFHYKFYFKKLTRPLLNSYQKNNRYFKEESDSFFEKRAAFLENLGPLDVVFVDGLHTFEASLKDVTNSLKYLNKNGVIIMHDCFPPSETAALPTKKFPTREEKLTVENWNGEWCGDVWKSIIYLKRKYPDILEVNVIDLETGLGIVKIKGELDKNNLEIDRELFNEIDQLAYNEIKENPEKVINLKKGDCLQVLIDETVAKANDMSR